MDLTTLVFALHIGAGLIALVSGAVAVSVRKGGSLHRRMGSIFVASMAIMAIFAAWLGVVRPGQIINVFIAAFVAYLVATSWLTVRRRDGASTGLPERLALAVSLLLCAPFALILFQVASGVTVFKTAFAIEGPILIALVSFSAVMAIAFLGDLRLVLAKRISGRTRIARHLWRMCLGLTLAAGSAFTNGFARLLPGPYHVPVLFFLPQFIPLVLLVYWMIRVRFTNWMSRGAILEAA